MEKKAFELEVGDQLKFSDGSYEEIVDLMAAGPAAERVAVFTEETEGPIVVPMRTTVTVAA